MALSLQLTLGGAVAQGGDRVECIEKHRRPLQRSHFSTPPVVTAPSAPARRLLLCWGHAAAHGSMLLDAGSFTVISANVEAHEEHTLARGYHGGSITNTAEDMELFRSLCSGLLPSWSWSAWCRFLETYDAFIISCPSYYH